MNIKRLSLFLIIIIAAGWLLSAEPLKSAYWRDVVNDVTKPLAQRLATVDSLIAAAGDPTARFEMLDVKLSLLKQNRQWTECLNIIDQMTGIDTEMSPRRHIELEDRRLQYLTHAGRYAESFRRSYAMLKEPVADSLKILMIGPLINIAFIKIELNMLHGYPSELTTTDSLLRVYAPKSRASDVEQNKELLLRTKVSYHTATGELETAMAEINQVMEMARTEEEKAMLYGYIADIYNEAGDREMAEHFYLKTIDCNPDLVNRMVAVCNLMDLLNNQGRYGETIDLYDRLIKAENLNTTTMLWLNVSSNYAKALNGVGRHAEAFDRLYDNVILRDSLFSSITGEDKISSFQLEDELLSKNEELAYAAKRSKLQLSVIGLLLLCIALAIRIITRQIRRRQASEKAIATLKHQLAETNEHVSEQNRELDARGIELSSRLLQMASIQENISEISSLVKSRNATPPERLKAIRERIRDIESNTNLWAMFQTYFEKTHPGFFRRLYELHPDLTSNETRMCAYIMLNLSGKEIASLTCRSYRTIETVKYRLHKKLGLDSESTQAYLRRITGPTAESDRS